MADPQYVYQTPNGGKVLSTQPFPNGNLVDSTAQAYFLGGLTDDGYLLGLKGMMPLPGLFSRSWSKRVNCAIDDIVCAASIEYFAKQILWRIRWNLGFLDVTYPIDNLLVFLSLILNVILMRLQIHEHRPWWALVNVAAALTACWFVRWRQFQALHAGFYQHLKFSANKWVGPLGRLIWALSLDLSSKAPVTNQDAWVQSHIMVLRMEMHYQARLQPVPPMLKRAVENWRAKKLKPTYQIMADYLTFSEHPLVTAWAPYD